MKPKISVVLPLLLPDAFTVALTQLCIKAMRCQADDPTYELVVVETGSRHFDPSIGGPVEPMLKVDEYIHIPQKRTYVQDWNEGARRAGGAYLVHMGNDVIVGPGWDSALREPFEKYADCGVSCTAATEPGAFIGPRLPVPGLVVEGMFAPMMMFESTWRLDEAYEGGYSDSDLIMRIYDSGKRAYRSCSSQCHHLDRVTWTRAYADRGEDQIIRGERLFYERWSRSPLMMYSMIRGGGVMYGREHEALLAPIPNRGQK